MAGLFSFTVDADAALVGLAAVVARVRDLTPFWRDVFAPNYFAEVQDLFALEGQPRGPSGRFLSGGWAPLSSVYAAWKNRHFPGQPLLQRTGRLKGSLEWSGAGLGPEGVFLPSPRAVVSGTSVPYAKHVNKTREFLPTPDAVTYGELMRAWILTGTA